MDHYVYQLKASMRIRQRWGISHKPRHVATARSIVSEDIVLPTQRMSLTTIRSRNQDAHVQNQADWCGPGPVELVPVIGVDLLGQPEQKVKGIEVALDACQQWLTSNESRHC